MTTARPRTSGRCSPQQLQVGEGVLSEGESLANALNVDRQTALQILLIDKLEQVRQAVLAPPRAAQDAKEVLVIVKTVVTAGTPVQGPEILVPPGYFTVVRQKRHTGTPRTGYLAFERSDTGNPLNRITFIDNDSIALPLEHLDSVWLDSDNNDTSFELIVGYGRRREAS